MPGRANHAEPARLPTNFDFGALAAMERQLQYDDLQASLVTKIDGALSDASESVEAAREALQTLRHPSVDGVSGALRALPVLLTVPQVCHLLGYRKTKVYTLMKRGLLPYVTDTRSGHRRIEYQAAKALAKRLRGSHLERKAS